MNPNLPKKPPASVSNEPEDLEPQIRLRAFELYQDRGGEDGHDQEDWLRAEEEITGRKTRTAVA